MSGSYGSGSGKTAQPITASTFDNANQLVQRTVQTVERATFPEKTAVIENLHQLEGLIQNFQLGWQSGQGMTPTDANASGSPSNARSGT